ncbi:MAG: Gp15 family bacteriophage protein [Clostridium sp.]
MKKQSIDFVAQQNSEEWYDILEDYDLIESSFAEQYGIRLRKENDMSWGEFCTLLSGINEKTALGKIVSIRAEKDNKIIKEFTQEQKRIRNQWKKRNVKNMDSKDYVQAIKNFENMFKAMAST